MEVNVKLKGIYTSEDTLKCPFCDFDCLHILSISVHRGMDKTVINNKGIFVKEEKNKLRGVVLIVEFCCEEGHHFNTITHFHKGSVYVEHEKLKTSCADIRDVWRD